MQKELKYIAVEGVIGAGKTSLARKLSERLNAKLVLEQFEANPFLGKFYTDRKRFAFQTQMFFLIDRYKQQEELFEDDFFTNCIVSDYIYEKDSIFAFLNLSADELKLYKSVFAALKKNIRKPDLVIYLQSSVDRLMYNIKKRNRDIETSMSRTYIEELNSVYDDFFFAYNDAPILVVNATEIDFVQNENDFEDLFAAIHKPDRAFREYLQLETKKL